MWSGSSYLELSQQMGVATDNLAFSPQRIDTVGLRTGEGASLQISIAIIQRTTAIRAYNSFSSGRDWIEKLSSAYVVALATRSADDYLMRKIQSCIVVGPSIECHRCREATIGTSVIRSRMFPELAALRKHANALIHHLDKLENQGIAELNVEAVFNYCYNLFQVNAELLFGCFPEESFPFMQCKECKAHKSKR